MLLTRSDARVDRVGARTVRSLPSVLADALAALARAVIGSGAGQTVKVVAREVVALAKLPTDNLPRQQSNGGTITITELSVFN